MDGADSVAVDQVAFTVDDADLLDGYYTLATKDATQSPTNISLAHFAGVSGGNTAVIWAAVSVILLSLTLFVLLLRQSLA